MPQNNLFPEFAPISKADWLNQITKDLKGKPLEEFDWHIGDDLRQSPFVHQEDLVDATPPIWAAGTGWKIGETIQVEEPMAANAQAMEALIGGAESLQFEFSSAPDYAILEATLSGIHLDYVGLHFSGNGIRQNPASLFGHLLRLAKAQQIDTHALHGSVSFNPVQAPGLLMDWRYLVDLIAFSHETFPGYKIISIDLSQQDNPAIALAEALYTSQNYFNSLTIRGISADQVARSIQFSVPVGKSYFLEIAKLRAFKLLWFNLLNGYGATLNKPEIAVQFQPEAYSDDIYTNMIRATTLAMSAVIGGADRLTILPYDAGRTSMASYPPAFGRRIARNVQHLMKMESALDEMADPAAGSYYIEQLTTKLSEKAWELFSERRAES